MAATKKPLRKPKNSLKTLKYVLGLVDKHGLNVLEFNGIRVEKARHLVAAAPAKATEPGKKKPDQDDSPIPGMPTTIEQLDAQIKRELGITAGGAF